MPRNDDFFRWIIFPVPDRCIVDHGLNALVDPEQDDVLYVAESVYVDRQAFAECLLHETYEWAYGSHQVRCHRRVLFFSLRLLFLAPAVLCGLAVLCCGVGCAVLCCAVL